MKTVYAHDYNGIYQGETQAQPHPFMPGEYLMPAYAIDVAPPSIPEGKVAQWSGSAWGLIDDPQIAAQAATQAAQAAAAQEVADAAAAVAAEQAVAEQAAANITLLAQRNSWGVLLNEMVDSSVVPRASEIVESETAINAWAALRLQRDDLLMKSDFSQLSDAPLSPEQKVAFTAYRAELRDLPENTEDPKNPEWPVKP